MNLSWNFLPHSGRLIGLNFRTAITGRNFGLKPRCPKVPCSFLILGGWPNYSLFSVPHHTRGRPHPLWRSCAGFAAFVTKGGIQWLCPRQPAMQLKIRRTHHRMPPFRKQRERMGHPFVSQGVGRPGHPAQQLRRIGENVRRMR